MEHLQNSDDMYAGDYLNVNNNSFPASLSSVDKSAKASGDLSYLHLLEDQAPFGGKKSDMFDNIMSPPITPGDKLHTFSSNGSSQLPSPAMPTFSNDLQDNMQFNLSPPLTISGAPDLQYGDLYHQDYETYNEQHQPIYTYMGGDPNAMPEIGYDEFHASHPAGVYTYNNSSENYGNLLKASNSDASISAWNSAAQVDAGYGAHNDWDNDDGAYHPKKIRDQGGQFECDFPECGKTFSKHTNLKSHSRTHHSERNYNCHDCHATFRRSHDLKRHQRSLHSDVKPYSCGRCAKRFSRMDALKRHTSRTNSACYDQSFP